MNTEQQAEAVAGCLNEHLLHHADLVDSIHRQLATALHTRQVVSIDAIHDEARRLAPQGSAAAPANPNTLREDRFSESDRATLHRVIRTHVSSHFSVADVDDLVILAIKREKVQFLENLAGLGNCCYRELAAKVQEFARLPRGETQLSRAEVMGTRAALTRHFISDQLEFIGIAKNYLTVRHFADLTHRIICTDQGDGKIGGKAGGMLLARGILASEPCDDDFMPIDVPDSYYLRSDVIEQFLSLNRLNEWQNQKYKPIEEVVRDYQLIKGAFRNCVFPVEIVQQLRAMLEKIGDHPVIVRSSSLLEDRFGAAFTGKYSSVFLANQGEPESRLRVLLAAVSEVYASVLAPDPIMYRREHNLIDYQEDMAVLIQKVVGTRVGDYFLPAFAGVAFGRNEYRWAPRIRKEDGLVRLVMGLGTRAVDRVGADYPRMIALGEPTLRPESSVHDIRRCAQRSIDAINLKTNRFETVSLADILCSDDPFPQLDRIVSVCRDDGLYSLPTTRVDVDPVQLCVTFDKLLRSTPFAQQVRRILGRLEEAYGMPVDMEFACDGEKFYVLQCRPQAVSPEMAPVTIPSGISNDRVLFDANRFVRSGLIQGIEYIVYIDPLTYDRVPTRQRRVEIGRVVGRLNRTLPARKFILIGPGRWGSIDLRLGVPVQYADINHARLLAEVARQTGGYLPEVSLGTHFFQDLVESNIHYLPLYPDEKGNQFNEGFFTGSPNALATVLPDDADLAEEVKLIHIPAVASGRTLTIAMDGQSDKALAYLE